MIRYPGGKKKFLKNIKEHIVAKNEYREPFFGGGSVGLSVIGDNQFDSYWFNDKDVGMFSLWTAIHLYPDELKEMVLKYTPTVDDFYNFKDYLLVDISSSSKEDYLINGFKKLAIHQISYSGLGTKSGGPLGGKNQDENTKYPIDCRWSPKHICKNIDKCSKLFNSVTTRITNLDYAELFADSDDAFIYLDPPYYDKGAELYQCSFTHENHVEMAKHLEELKCKWLLSYDDCEEIRNMYKWANIENVAGTYTINGSFKKNELLITDINS